MNRLATYLTYGLALAAFTVSVAKALPSQSVERAEIFATCSGRLSALATRQRAMNDPSAPEIERLSDQFSMLLDATLPDAIQQGVEATQSDRWRNSGWSEMANLLADVDYSVDQRRVDRARSVLEKRLATCRALLL